MADARSTGLEPIMCSTIVARWPRAAGDRNERCRDRVVGEQCRADGIVRTTTIGDDGTIKYGDDKTSLKKKKEGIMMGMAAKAWESKRCALTMIFMMISAFERYEFR